VSKPNAENQSPLILAPNGDGITIEGNGQNAVTHYGKDFLSDDGTTWNIVRIDDHTLKSTFAINGKVIVNETATVSPDGKRYTRVQQPVGGSGKATIEHERIGSVPAGDLFFGTWKRIPRPDTTGPLTVTLKVDSETFDLTQRSRHMLTAKFDGKDYIPEAGIVAVQVKRIDRYTIEMVQKIANSPIATTLWQVKGDILTRTLKASGAQGQPNVQEFERAK